VCGWWHHLRCCALAFVGICVFALVTAATCHAVVSASATHDAADIWLWLFASRWLCFCFFYFFCFCCFRFFLFVTMSHVRFYFCLFLVRFFLSTLRSAL